ncbi:MAG: hypothetical protein ACR2NM_09400, partial [Bythopirellula sp.]
GQLVIYAYDEQSRAAYETQPTRRFVFPAEQFTRHESECQLGASYSIWLPWDEVGGAQKNISLIARFEPKEGAVVAGNQTRHLLPGSAQLATGETMPATKPVDEIQLTAYTQTSNVEPPKKLERPQVTSIALPGKSWAQRLQRAQEEDASSVAASSATVEAPTVEAPTVARTIVSRTIVPGQAAAAAEPSRP